MKHISLSLRCWLIMYMLKVCYMVTVAVVTQLAFSSYAFTVVSHLRLTLYYWLTTNSTL